MIKFRLIYLIFLSLILLVSGYSQNIYPSQLSNTYSIVARDTATGQIGVAVQTHWFGVGTRVSWAEAGVGAIATQSFTNPSFGPRALALLKEGKTAQEALQILIDSDEGRDYRQLAIVDVNGNTAAWTGKKCIAEAGHLKGDNFSVQANLMLNDQVWSAMSVAFQNSAGDLANRLLAALEAGQAAGGDIRGKQSAAMIIVRAQNSGRVWEDRLIDLRIDDYPEPIKELRRLLRIKRAYMHMNKGDAALDQNDIKTALKEYETAEKCYPENLEIKYWHAVSLANMGKLEQALPLFEIIFEKNKNWWILTRRLPEVDLLNVNDRELQRILSLIKEE